MANKTSDVGLPVSRFALHQMNPMFSRHCRKGILKTSWENDKMLVTSIFSFSRNVFYPHNTLLQSYRIIWPVCDSLNANTFPMNENKMSSCKHFMQLGKGKNLIKERSLESWLAFSNLFGHFWLASKPFISIKDPDEDKSARRYLPEI